jgi:hypothetical protein
MAIKWPMGIFAFSFSVIRLVAEADMYCFFFLDEMPHCLASQASMAGGGIHDFA